jgi:UDP-N-acetylmuramate dehydrogenase
VTSAFDLDFLAGRLRESLRGRVERCMPLARYTTYKLGGPAELYVEPADAEDLAVAAEVVAASGMPPGERPLLVLGRGSNLVVSDAGWPGMVVRLGPGFSDIVAAGGRGHVTAGAATTLPLLANWAARRSLSGLEWGVGVPGSVGGAVRMNAGAHGTDVAATLVAASTFDFVHATAYERAAVELGLAYRRSTVADGHIVTGARLHLVPDEEASIRARMDAYRKHRSQTQPGALQNAGSTFKNPPGDAAGRLVEAAGLKGFRVGAARVSELHANFFMAGEGATAQDVYDLVHEVRGRVRDTFGIELEPEVRFAGRFDETARAQVLGP